MKKLKNLILISLAIVPAALSLMLSFLRAAPLENCAAASENNISLFFVTPTLVRTHGDLVYVYDSADQTIKIVDSKTNEFAETASHYRAKADDILFFKDNMLVFSKQDQSIIARRREADGFKEIEFDTSSLTTLADCKAIHIVEGEESYILLCPADIKNGTFEVAKITESADRNSIELSGAKTLTVQEGDESPIQNYDVSCASISESKIVLLLANSNLLASLTISPEEESATIEQATSVGGITGFEPGENIVALNHVLFGGEPFLALTTTTHIRFYRVVSSQSLSEDVAKRINLDPSFNPVNVWGAGSIIGEVSTESKALRYYLLDGTEVQTKTKVNDIIDTHINSEESFNYRQTPSDVAMLTSPYGNQEEASELVKMVPAGSNLVVIGYGIYRDDGKAVNGWDYCLFSSGIENFYGYVFNLELIDLEPVQKDRTYITVQPNTMIYSLPSANIDDPDRENAIISNVMLDCITKPLSTRLEVLGMVYDYSYVNGNREIKFFRVRVNGNIGYVDRALVAPVSSARDRVVPDATVMRDNSQIFESKDAGSNVIMTLNKNYRVKVIGKRDTITNLTHIRFNDSEGNEIEGYIYTYNLEADTWNMVQMIGILLIVINVILLIVIICLKNRMTR